MDTQPRPRLAGKAALITGGAGSIGLATAQAFVAAGAQVVIADLDPAPLEAAVARIGSDSVASAVCDVTNPADVERAVTATVSRFGKLDVAFANAGVFGVVAAVTEYPVDVFERVMAVNVTGSFLVAQHALRVMEAGGSLIINSSVVGLTSDQGIAAYATSKHAVVGLMIRRQGDGAQGHPGQHASSRPHRQRLPARHRGRGDRRQRGRVGHGVR